MHFEFLLEDQSSSKAMDILMPKLLGSNSTYRIHSYKGIGDIQKGLRPNSDASKRILLHQLPRILRGYGRNPDCGIIVIICDLDDRDKTEFLSELHGVYNSCAPKPETLFCLAIEEFEAWYLGDLVAVRKAYPNSKSIVLSKYENDSICGTWQLLADATYKGGHLALKKKGWQAIGKQKYIWAETISPHMIISDNISPSFNFMCNQLQHYSSLN